MTARFLEWAEGSEQRKHSSEEGSSGFEDIVYWAYHWCVGGILKETGYRILEHHESWRRGWRYRF